MCKIWAAELLKRRTSGHSVKQMWELYKLDANQLCKGRINVMGGREEPYKMRSREVNYW